jgi:hypothetical protein
MGITRLVARVFIDFFSITPPSPEEERRVNWILFAMTLLVIAAVAGIFCLIVFTLAR